MCFDTTCTKNSDCVGGAVCREGMCVRHCDAAPSCPKPFDVCVPGGYGLGDRPICFDTGCSSDADCSPGYGCVTRDTGGACEPIGDPTFILAVAEEQWRKDYVFLTPNAYAQDYVNVIAPAGAVVTLDGAELKGWSTIAGGSGLSVVRVPIEDGPHDLAATHPVSVVVYGYDDDVSYGYAGGTNLNVINP